MIHIDFETYSAVDLKVVGAYRYAQDPSTEILVMCWAEDSGEVQAWLPHTGAPLHPRLVRAVRTGNILVAHNAQFERAIWQAIMAKRHGAPPTKRTQWHCTAARAATAGLARSLEGSTSQMNLSDLKDPRGKALLRKFAQPRKPTKKDPRTRILPMDAPEEFGELVAYCAQDVRAERGLDEALPPMTKEEIKLFALDMKINERGIPIDVPLVKKALHIVQNIERSTEQEVVQLTGGIRPTQTEKLQNWLLDRGVPLSNLQADHIRSTIKLGVDDAKARRVLLLRMEAAKVSTKKLVAMLRCVGLNSHRVRGTILFHGAHTGRWSGKLVQPHNFIRGNLKLNQQGVVLRALEMADPDLMRMLWEWPLDAISQVMRSFIVASPGQRLLVADYAAIEARVLAWLAQELAVLDAYRRGVDVYKMMAARVWQIAISAVTDDQRRIGKNLVLGCGYGLGYKKFVDHCAKAGVIIDEDFSQLAVKAYRDAHKAIVQYWRDVQRAFAYAATNKKECNVRQIKFGWWQGWVYIELPSGRRLYYWNVRVKMLPPRFGRPDQEITYDGGEPYREKLYGGKLVENIVQAISRDIMAAGMTNAEDADYPVVSTIHDEVVAERVEGEGTLDEYVSLLCTLPKWAAGCPIDAKGFETQRYRKD